MIITLSTKSAKINRMQTITYTKYEYNKSSCLELGDGSNENSTKSEFVIYFPQADDTNFNKIKKALEHLRDLLKAADDPFGN